MTLACSAGPSSHPSWLCEAGQRQDGEHSPAVCSPNLPMSPPGDTQVFGKADGNVTSGGKDEDTHKVPCGLYLVTPSLRLDGQEGRVRIGVHSRRPQPFPQGLCPWKSTRGWGIRGVKHKTHGGSGSLFSSPPSLYPPVGLCWGNSRFFFS